mmetsp:Transcript_7389/g.16302  ORF Transcript_7389/g.16302 Transcript_7389/m.16302 type:complete len:112 (+) Transcript_7389:54-389(+)
MKRRPNEISATPLAWFGASSTHSSVAVEFIEIAGSAVKLVIKEGRLGMDKLKLKLKIPEGSGKVGKFGKVMLGSEGGAKKEEDEDEDEGSLQGNDHSEGEDEEEDDDEEEI